jgi:lambda repressor-like predicted transcriptional regulator
MAVKITPAKAEGAARDALRIEMIRRGLTCRILAARIGLSRGTVNNVLSGNNQTWPPRRLINTALKMKIFTRPAKAGRNAKPKPR